MNIFEQLEKIHQRPKPFEFYTAKDLWTDEHTSRQMLSFHLNEDIDVSSRNKTFIDRSVKWMASHFGIGPGIKVADFGCGPGIYTTRLAEYQADVTGIDFSERSLEYARQTAQTQKLPINYVHTNYLEYESDRPFHLILMIFCDFCALSPEQRKILLIKFHSSLKTDGAVLLDVVSQTAYGQREEKTSFEVNLLDGFWSASKYYGFLNTFKYEDEKVVLDKYTLIEPERTRTIYNWLQYFSPESLAKEFAENGFIIEKVYGDVAGAAFNPDSDEFAIVAKKA